MELTGKRALVTGSSRGIGRAIAVALARQGAEVIVHCAGNLAKAQETASQIQEFGGKATVLSCDLSQPDTIPTFCNALGDVDILVLNASIQIRRPWEEISIEEFYTQINCNLLASMLLIQQCVPHMRQQKWGRIITVGSVQEAKPHPDMLVYSASKAAQSNMVHSLSVQLAKDGITVNSMAPGVIYTDRNVEALADPQYAAQVASTIPVGFWGTPEDCAGIVSLLCSQQGRYITGQNIYVDGGKSVQ